MNLQETDTVTELCHVGEAVIPHDLNKEYRLKHVFVDVGGASPDPSSVPSLSPHEYIYAAHQAQRFGVEIEKLTSVLLTLSGVEWILDVCQQWWLDLRDSKNDSTNNKKRLRNRIRRSNT